MFVLRNFCTFNIFLIFSSKHSSEISSRFLSLLKKITNRDRRLPNLGTCVPLFSNLGNSGKRALSDKKWASVSIMHNSIFRISYRRKNIPIQLESISRRFFFASFFSEYPDWCACVLWVLWWDGAECTTVIKTMLPVATLTRGSPRQAQQQKHLPDVFGDVVLKSWGGGYCI